MDDVVYLVIASVVIRMFMVSCGGRVGYDDIFAGCERLDTGIASGRFPRFLPIAVALHQPVPRFRFAGLDKTVGGQ